MHRVAAVMAMYRGHWNAEVVVRVMFTPSVKYEGNVTVVVPISGMFMFRSVCAMIMIKMMHVVLVMTEYRGFFHAKLSRVFA